MVPRLIRRGILLVFFAVLLVRGQGTNNDGSLANLREHGWHCYSEDVAPGELPTDRAPCLKVIHPAEGYSVIPTLADHFQFEVDVTPRENEQISWYQMQKDGSEKGGKMHQIQECRNHLVCNARILRDDQHQTLFPFRVAVSYLGRDEMTSQDIVLEVAKSEKDRGVKGLRASTQQEEQFLDHPASKHTDEVYSADSPVYLKASDQDVGLEYDNGDSQAVQNYDYTTLGDADTTGLLDHTSRGHIPNRGPVGLGQAVKRRPESHYVYLPANEQDYADYDFDDLSPAYQEQTADVYSGADLPVAEMRDNSNSLRKRHLQPLRYHDELQPDSIVDTGDKLGGTGDRDTMVVLDAIESLKERLGPAAATPQATADHSDMRILSEGLDSMRTNITQILSLLSKSKRQKQDQVRGGQTGGGANMESASDTDSEDMDDRGESELLESNRTSRKHETRNGTMLNHLGEMARGLLDQSCRHLMNSYEDLQNHSQPTKNHLSQVSKKFHKTPRTGDNSHNDIDSSRPVIKGNQRRLAGLQEIKDVEDDFLSMWNEVGLTDDDELPNKRHIKRKPERNGQPQTHGVNGNGKTGIEEVHNVASHNWHTGKNSELGEYLKPSGGDDLQTEVMTFLTPEPGVVVRHDLVVVHPTPILDDDLKNPLSSQPGQHDDSESSENSQPNLEEDLETQIMTFVTPEPGVVLRKDLVVVRPNPIPDAETRAANSDFGRDAGTGGRFEQRIEGDELQTELMEIVTPEPGVILRHDLVLIQPKPKPLDLENGLPDFISFEDNSNQASSDPFKDYLFGPLSEETNENTFNGPSEFEFPPFGNSEVSPKSSFNLPGVNRIQLPELYLQPFPEGEEEVEYQTALIPTVAAKFMKGSRTESPVLKEHLSKENLVGDELFGNEVDANLPTVSLRPTSLSQDSVFGIEDDDTDIFDHESALPTRAMYNEPQTFKSPLHIDDNAEYPPPYRPGLEFEYDDTGVFDHAITTTQPNGLAMDESQIMPTEKGSLSYTSTTESNLDQVYHRLGVILTTDSKSDSGTGDFDIKNSFKIYDYPFPDSKVTPTTTWDENTISYSEDDSDILVSPYPYITNFSSKAAMDATGNADHRLVHWSITGKTEAGNLDFLSDVVNLLQVGEVASKVTNRLPQPPDGRGNNVVIISQEDHGIHIGVHDADKITPTDAPKDFHQEALPSLLGKLITDHQHLKKTSKRTQTGKPEIHIRIDDEDGNRLSIHKEATGQTGNGGNSGIRQIQESRGHESRTGDDDGVFRKEYDEDANEMDVDDEEISEDNDALDDDERDQHEDGPSTLDNTRLRRARRYVGITEDDVNSPQQDKVKIGNQDHNDNSTVSHSHLEDTVDQLSEEQQRRTVFLTSNPTKKQKTEGDDPLPVINSDQREAHRDRREDISSRDYGRADNDQLPPPVDLITKPVTASSAWSAWSAWSTCSVTCGRGEIFRQRNCLQEYGRDICIGNSEDSAECVVDACLDVEKGEEIVQEEGHSTEIECRYDTTKTPKEIYWMSPTGEKISKDSTAFSEKFQITGSKLIIRGVQSVDEGTYHCVVIMNDDSSETADAKIDVLSCKTDPCQNGGRCVEHDTSNGLLFKCVCTVGFEGHTCEQVSSLFIGDAAMAAIAVCILVVVLLGVFIFFKRRAPTKMKLPQSNASPTAVVQMDTISPNKALLTDAEIDLFREISREEFKNFKSSHSYSLFKGKKTSKSQATIETEEIEQTVDEANERSHGTVYKKPLATDLKEIHIPAVESSSKSSKHIASPKVKVERTPTKKSSSAESVSLPSSPAPAMEEVEQQRSTHIALSGQGQSSVEDVLALAGYQESKPRQGSASSVLSSSVPIPPPTMQQRRSLADSKPRSGSSISSGSGKSRSSTSRVKRALFDAGQSECRTSRHSVTYGEDKEEIEDVSVDSASRHSHRSHTMVDTPSVFSRPGSASSSSHAAPLIVKSSSGKLRAVRYEDPSRQRRPTLPGSLSLASLPERRQSSTQSSLKVTTGVEESQTWIPITESTAVATPVKKLHTPSTSRSSTITDVIGKQSDVARDLSLDSSGTRQYNADQEMKITSIAFAEMLSGHSFYEAKLSSGSVASRILEQSEIVKDLSEDVISAVHSVVDVQQLPHPKYESLSEVNIPKKKTSSSVCTSPLIVKSSSGNLRAVTPEEHEQRRQTLLGSPLVPSSPRRSSALSSDSPRSDSVFHASVASSKKSDSVLEGLNEESATASGEESSHAMQVNRQSKFGFPAYTRRFSLPTESHAVINEISEKPSSHLRTGTDEVETMQGASSTYTRRLSLPAESNAVIAEKPSSHLRTGTDEVETMQGASATYTRRLSLPAESNAVIAEKSSSHLRTGTDEVETMQKASSTYTRRLSLPAVSNAVIAEKPSSHSRTGTNDVGIMQKPSSTGSCLSRESRSSSQSAVLTAKEIARVFSGQTPSFVNTEKSASLISTEDFLHKSVSETNQEHVVADSSYHTAVGAFIGIDTAATAEGTPSAMPDSHSYLETDNHQDVDALTSETSHHWQPLPEFDGTEFTISSHSHLMEEPLAAQSDDPAKIPIPMPTAISTFKITSSKDELLSDWRPLPEYASVDEGTDVDHTHMNRVTSFDPGLEVPAANSDILEPAQYGEDEIPRAVDSDHSQQEVSQTRRASKFGYSGYVEKFSHLVDDTLTPLGDHTPAELEVEESVLVPPAALAEAFQSSENDDDDVDLSFDDAREGISDQEESDKGSEFE